MMKRGLGVLIFLIFFLLTVSFAVWGSYRRAMFDVCRLVERNYYKSADSFVVEWLSDCQIRASAQPLIVSKERSIFEINSLLSQLAVSHLSLYTPQENKSMWENEAVDTGLRALNIDGDLFVSDVIIGSVAAEAKLRVGDKIALVNDQPVSQAIYVETMRGFYTIERASERFSVDLQPRALALDLRAQLLPLESGAGVLRIQSFLSQYFERDEWIQFAKHLNEMNHIILDLRGNVGGSFPAMLRAASSLYCEARVLGALEKNADQDRHSTLADDLNAEHQVRQMEPVSKMNLATFPGYPCYQGKLTVLVNSDTASTAEILAEALKQRPNTRVWGERTAGQVVMGRWFPVTSLGAGDYSLAIPIAGYRSAAGLELEDSGVEPERKLIYRRSDIEAGRDSWIEDALKR